MGQRKTIKRSAHIDVGEEDRDAVVVHKLAQRLFRIGRLDHAESGVFQIASDTGPNKDFIFDKNHNGLIIVELLHHMNYNNLI